ncbi:MAG: hypothetical protein U9O56_09890 [Campylobacterota bacterium]|nr:hypothetical protein [Campylobacterota bacterium]
MKHEVNEKTIRLRYIRILEKFNTKAVTLLKYDNFDLELFKKAILKGYETLQNTKSVPLYSEYPMQVQKFSQDILNSLDNHTKDFEEEKQYLLKQFNLLQKNKNNNNYKKDKHKKKKFTDGY